MTKRERLIAAVKKHIRRELECGRIFAVSADSETTDVRTIQGDIDIPVLIDAILAELAIPDEAMIEAATRRTQGPDDSLYGTIFSAMIESVKGGA